MYIHSLPKNARESIFIHCLGMPWKVYSFIAWVCQGKFIHLFHCLEMPGKVYSFNSLPGNARESILICLFSDYIRESFSIFFPFESVRTSPFSQFLFGLYERISLKCLILLQYEGKSLYCSILLSLNAAIYKRLAKV